MPDAPVVDPKDAGLSPPTNPETPPAPPADPSGDAEGQGSESKPTAPEFLPVFKKRVDTLTAQKRELERENAALKAMVQPTPPQEPNLDQIVQSRAQDLTRQRMIDEASNRTYAAGKEKYPDFDAAVGNVVAAGEVTPAFLEAVTKLPNAADVYYHLGQNPGVAANLLGLDTIPMVLELAQISAKVGKPKLQSKAPAPVTPVAGSGVADVGLRDDIGIEEWMRRREAQLKR